MQRSLTSSRNASVAHEQLGVSIMPSLESCPMLLEQLEQTDQRPPARLNVVHVRDAQLLPRAETQDQRTNTENGCGLRSTISNNTCRRQ
jgi:hypothetical protein